MLFHKSEGKCCNEKNKVTDDCILILKIIIKYIENVAICSKSEINAHPGVSLVVQWVRLCTPNAGGLGSIPGRRNRSRRHATTETWSSQDK